MGSTEAEAATNVQDQREPAPTEPSGGDGMTDDRQQVQETLESAVEQVRSPAAAAKVLDRLEKAAAGATEAEAGGAAAEAPLSPPAVVQQAAASADHPTERAAAALTAAAAEAVAPTNDAAPTLEAAQRVFQPQSVGEQPKPELERPRSYLQQEVLRRMSPLQAFDAWIFLAVNHLPHNRLTNSLMYALTVVMTGGVAWELGTLYAWLRRRKRSRRALRELVPSVALATLIVEYPIKAYFRRRRPFIEIVRALVIGKKPGSWSFPSGHTCSSFAAARVLSTVWPRYAPLYYALASLVGFSRIYLGAHYPGDVLSGAFAGTVFGELARRATRAIAARR
jgi:membrane-associated phospholipid phosphatase